MISARMASQCVGCPKRDGMRATAKGQKSLKCCPEDMDKRIIRSKRIEELDAFQHSGVLKIFTQQKGYPASLPTAHNMASQNEMLCSLTAFGALVRDFGVADATGNSSGQSCICRFYPGTHLPEDPKRLQF
jgi:hypothetical protein